jgi:putative endonuclease
LFWKTTTKNKGIAVSRTNKNLGALGEKIAEKFLTSRRFRIIDRNFSTPFGEIDLVAEQADYTVFIEVKTRTSDKFGSPLSSITREKQNHIVKNCQFYIKRYSLCGKPCRIDVIGISLCKSGKLKVLNHIKNAIII